VIYAERDSAILRDHGISEVEAIIPDMAGIARGKLMPAEKIRRGRGHAASREHLSADRHRRLPERYELGHESGGNRHRAQGRSEDGARRALGGRAHRTGDFTTATTRTGDA